MDYMTDQQEIVNDEALPVVPPAGTVQAVLLRLTQWQALIDRRLRSQLTLLEAMERFALVELRSHYPQGNIDANFMTSLVNAVLQQIIDRKPLVFLPMLDAPYRWPGGADLALPADRREVVIKTVAAVASYFVDQYKQYLREHWETTGQGTGFDRLLARKLKRCIIAIDKTFRSDRLTGLKADQLRDRLEKLQETNVRRYRLTALATSRERKNLEAISFSQLPHWLQVLSEPDRDQLGDYQEQATQAQGLVDELLDGYGSLQAYARQQAIDYIRLKLDMEVEPDSIQVQLMWRSAVGQPIQTRSLSELLAAGPIREDCASVLKVSEDISLRNQSLEPAFISEMLSGQDYPAQYLQALVEQYGREDLKSAMVDWFTVRLRQSAFIARCAGHMTLAEHDQLEKLWDSNASAQPSTSLHVAGLTLPNAMKCADLLLFYREGAGGEVSDFLLYAPNKPDGQEWIRLATPKALSWEVGGWTRDEAGREYLLQQLSPDDRRRAREYFVGISAKPGLWDISRDLRRPAAAFVDCVGDAVLTGLANNLAQVEQDHSPRWYSTLSLDARRSISSLNQEFVVHQQVFNDLLAEYEVFIDFAKRTVAQGVTPYLRSKGVLEPVDPATVLVDYNPGLFDGSSQVASLLDLAIRGYDDNWGIDHPKRGVRSSVGQDLSLVRSADLALYIRTAYLGEKYASEIRGRFLDSRDSKYYERRYAYLNVLLSKMDRDLRVARSKAQLSDKVFSSLIRQVTRLSAPVAAVDGSVSSVVTSDGVIKFTIRGHVVLGVYVFALFDPDGSYWLYTPDAPDGVTFREYQGLRGETAAQLHDYVMARVANSARQTVQRSLQALAANNMTVDTLYEHQRVGDARAEFNAYIERSVTDVEDITTSRAEMIKNQVFKGLMLGAVPFCMVFPPFALLMDIAFIAISTEQAIKAHREGDTQGALGHWLVASWGALFAVVGARSAGKLLGRALTNLKHATRPVSLLTQRLKSTAPLAVRETLPVSRTLRLKPKQAVSRAPESLEKVTDEGIFYGTWRRPASATQPQPAYYIRSKGRYYQVKKSPHFDGLCLVDASRPAAIYNPPVRLTAAGKWVHDKVGLRGGNGRVRNLGSVDNLRNAFPGRVEPVVNRGAMQGEAVVARFAAGAMDNYLFSLNAQTCVIASLYNPTTKIGAVIHFDHNIRALIERSLKDVMQRLGGTAKDIRSTLVGGDWLTGTDIGGQVRSVMRQQGLQPAWDYWSYSSCLGNNYAVSLNLSSGVTTVFKTSIRQVDRYYTPILRRAGQGTGPVSGRADMFMRRFRQKPLHENASGVVVDSSNRPASPERVEGQAFAMVLLS